MLLDINAFVLILKHIKFLDVRFFLYSGRNAFVMFGKTRNFSHTMLFRLNWLNIYLSNLEFSTLYRRNHDSFKNVLYNDSQRNFY